MGREHIRMFNYKLLVAYVLIAGLMKDIDGGQPQWNRMLNGHSIYAFSTETWEECGLLCTRNFQRIDPGLAGTSLLHGIGMIQVYETMEKCVVSLKALKIPNPYLKKMMQRSQDFLAAILYQLVDHVSFETV